MLKNLCLTAVMAVAGVLIVAGPLEGRPRQPATTHVYAVPGDFLIPLEGGHNAYLRVALILAPGSPIPTPYLGTDPYQRHVRAVITDVVSERPVAELRQSAGLEQLKRRIAQAVMATTDLLVRSVLFTDRAVT